LINKGKVADGVVFTNVLDCAVHWFTSDGLKMGSVLVGFKAYIKQVKVILERLGKYQEILGIS
jgi:hypothetical protein